MFRWRKRRSEGAVPPETINGLLRLNAYQYERKDDTLACELTPAQFAEVARRNGWQPATVRLLLELTGVPGRAPWVPRINMGRLRVTVIDQSAREAQPAPARA